MLGETPAVLRRVDDVQLAAVHEHEVRAERAALFTHAVPDFHPARPRMCGASAADWDHQRIFANLHGAVRQPLCARALGVLAKSNVARQPRGLSTSLRLRAR